jgi:hypothetical protein
MSWLAYKYKSRKRRPTPPWMIWGMIVFFGLGILMASRNPQVADHAAFPALDLKAYRQRVLPGPLHPTEEPPDGKGATTPSPRP